MRVFGLVPGGMRGGSSDSSSAESGTAATADASADSVAGEEAIANLIAATDGTVELELWCSETEEYQTVMAELVDEFEAEYSDVDFDITIGAVSEADAKDKVLEDVEAAADVFVFADDQLSELVTAGALQQVSTSYTYDPEEANSDAAIEAASSNGDLYAYPLTSSNGYFLYYNSEYLSEDDVSSWENLVATAEEQGKKVGMNMADSGWYLYGFFSGAGCTLSMNEDGSNTCDWNSETGLAVAESITNISSSDAFVSLAEEDAMTMVADGDLIAYVCGTWRSGEFEENYGDGYAATKLPTFDVDGTATQMGSFAGYKFVGVNSYSDNVGWSMLLAEYLTSESSQEAIYDATGEGPSNTEALSKASSVALDALAEQAPYADLQIVGDKYWDPSMALANSLASYDGSDLQTLLDDAVDGITQAVDSDSEE